MKKAIATAAISAALIAGALAAAGTASANSADSRFIDRLREGGIHIANESKAIATGHNTCEMLDGGYSVDQVAEFLYTHTPIPLYNSGYIVGAAVYAFCPEYGKQIH